MSTEIHPRYLINPLQKSDANNKEDKPQGEKIRAVWEAENFIKKQVQIKK